MVCAPVRSIIPPPPTKARGLSLRTGAQTRDALSFSLWQIILRLSRTRRHYDTPLLIGQRMVLSCDVVHFGG